VTRGIDQAPVIPPHYPYVTRMALELYECGALPDVASIEVEPEYGYATRITYRCGARRMTYGNDVGLNPGAAADVAQDKAYTKFFLQQQGVTCAAGGAFVLPSWLERIAGGLAERGFAAVRPSSEGRRFAERDLGLPVYVKPVHGSKGSGVFRCDAGEDVDAALADLEERHVRVALIEEAVDLPDYRLVVLHGELISGYLRRPLAVTGDGTSTVLELLDDLAAAFRAAGRDTRIEPDDPRIAMCLAREARDLSFVPAAGEGVRLHDVSNLSTGGTAQDVTPCVADGWRRLAARVSDCFALDFCGVDLACADIEDATAAYAVLEVNAAPGLDHYAAVGPTQEATVRGLYSKVLNAAPARRG
jgi:D-alanine-D-alanine ligase-like ATP-grasp enzyme